MSHSYLYCWGLDISVFFFLFCFRHCVFFFFRALSVLHSPVLFRALSKYHLSGRSYSWFVADTLFFFSGTAEVYFCLFVVYTVFCMWICHWLESTDFFFRHYRSQLLMHRITPFLCLFCSYASWWYDKFGKIIPFCFTIIQCSLRLEINTFDKHIYEGKVNLRRR